MLESRPPFKLISYWKILSDILAVKVDMEAVKTDVGALRADMETFKAEIKGEMLVLKWVLGLIIVVEVRPFVRFLFA